MQNSPVTRSIADASYNGILAGYLRACKANEKPSGTFPRFTVLCFLVF